MSLIIKFNRGNGNDAQILQILRDKHVMANWNAPLLRSLGLLSMISELEQDVLHDLAPLNVKIVSVKLATTVKYLQLFPECIRFFDSNKCFIISGEVALPMQQGWNVFHVD